MMLFIKESFLKNSNFLNFYYFYIKKKVNCSILLNINYVENFLKRKSGKFRIVKNNLRLES